MKLDSMPSHKVFKKKINSWHKTWQAVSSEIVLLWFWNPTVRTRASKFCIFLDVLQALKLLMLLSLGWEFLPTRYQGPAAYLLPARCHRCDSMFVSFINHTSVIILGILHRRKLSLVCSSVFSTQLINDGVCFDFRICTLNWVKV